MCIRDRFDDVFPGGRFPGKTLLQILSPESTTTGSNGGNVAVARAVAAALLNAASGRTSSILNVDQVKAMWVEFVDKGYYSPTNGIKSVSYTHLDVYKRQVLR